MALPLMQRAPFWAGIWLGVVWAVWHVPAFFLSGTPQSGCSLPGFLLGCVALSVILTPMFDAAGGSLLVAAPFHFQINGGQPGPMRSPGIESFSRRWALGSWC